MIKMTKLAVLLLLTQAGFADEIEEGVSYAYPFFFDDTDSVSYEHPSNPELKIKSSHSESSTAQHATVGNVKFTFDGENADFASQCKAEWDKKKKKEEPKKERKSRFRKDNDDKKEDKEDDRSPKARLSIKWSNED